MTKTKKNPVLIAEEATDELASLKRLFASQIASLSAQNTSLANENAKLSADLSTLASQSAQRIETLEAQLVEAKAELKRLIEQIKFANMRHFGTSSERIMVGQLSLFNLAEAEADPSVSEPCLEKALEQKPRRRGGKRKIDYSKYETIVIEHEIVPADAVCERCGDTLEEMNVETTHKVKLVPAHLVVEEHRRHVYRCKSCSKANAEGQEVPSTIVRAPMPASPIQNSFASASLISYVIYGKYINALPLYRMEQDFKSLGITISRQNMANWIINVHTRWLSKVHARMKASLLELPRLHADESIVQVLKEPDRAPKQKSRMWLFCSAACDVPIYIFEYHPTRRKGVAQEFLQGWSGTLTTDGYKPYFNLGIPNITNVACLVHVRRYFARIVKAAGGDEKAQAADSVALEARRKIDQMFKIDAKFAKMDAPARKRARKKYLKPCMEEFLEFAKREVEKALPGLALYKALTYAITYWPYVENVLEDGHLELSNNRAERAIRSFVIGRKNYLFSDTPNGAHASAAIYSIVLTARENGLDPRRYVEWLLDELPNAGTLTDKVIDNYLPWSESVPSSCRVLDPHVANTREIADDPILDIDPDLENDEMVNNEKEDF